MPWCEFTRVAVPRSPPESCYKERIRFGRSAGTRPGLLANNAQPFAGSRSYSEKLLSRTIPVENHIMPPIKRTTGRYCKLTARTMDFKSGSESMRLNVQKASTPTKSSDKDVSIGFILADNNCGMYFLN